VETRKKHCDIYHLHYLHDYQEQTVTRKIVILNKPAAKNKHTNPRIGWKGIKPLYTQKCELNSYVVISAICVECIL